MSDENPDGSADAATNDQTLATDVDDDRQKAYAARDAAKARAREAEARAAALAQRVAELDAVRGAMVESKVTSALVHVDPQLHKAAKAVLGQAAIDVGTSDADVVAVLREHGLITARRGGSPGAPGANFDVLPPGEDPRLTGDERARELARRLSGGGPGPMEHARELRERTLAEQRAKPTMTEADVVASAQRLSALASAGQRSPGEDAATAELAAAIARQISRGNIKR